MELNKTLDFYRNKKIYLTGHTGFKGSWLSFLFDSIGAEVVGYSLNPTTSPSLFNTLTFSKSFKSIIGDIRNMNEFEKSITNFNPDFIFHMAAQPIVLDSYNSPLETFTTNFNGTLNLLEIIRKNNLNVTTIFVTTDKVYENKELNIPFKENDPIGGNDPYSASKGSSELLIQSYKKSFFNNSNIASVRAGNVIGGGDWSNNRLIPDIIKSVFENKKLEIRNPNSTRPWQHVLDPLFGYLKLGIALNENPREYSGSWNFGPDDEKVITVQDILRKTSDVGLKLSLDFQKEKTLYESNFLKLNISKAKKELKWFPRWDTDTSIEKTIEWYKKFYANNSVDELLKNDINDFLKSTP